MSRDTVSSVKMSTTSLVRPILILLLRQWGQNYSFMHDIIFANRNIDRRDHGIQPIRLLFTHRPIRSQMDAIWNVFTPKLTDFVHVFLFLAGKYLEIKLLRWGYDVTAILRRLKKEKFNKIFEFRCENVLFSPLLSKFF